MMGPTRVEVHLADNDLGVNLTVHLEPRASYRRVSYGALEALLAAATEIAGAVGVNEGAASQLQVLNEIAGRTP